MSFAENHVMDTTNMGEKHGHGNIWKYTVYNQSYKLYSRSLNGLVSRQKLTWKNTTKLLAKENVIPRSRSKIFDFWEAK